ncbi:MAG: hypothetical protein ACXVCH_16440 [Bdellovibrionota bacterium]
MTPRKPTILVQILSAGVLLASSVAFAATNPPGQSTATVSGMDTRPFDIGPVGGIGFYNSSQGNNFLIGATGHWKPSPKFDVGGYFSYSGLNGNPPSGVNSVNFSSNLYLILPEVNYHFTEAPGLYAGMKAGLGIYHTNNNGVSTTDGELALGPAVGYDYVIAGTGGLSVGGQLNFINVTTGTAINAVNLIAVVKY